MAKDEQFMKNTSLLNFTVTCDVQDIREKINRQVMKEFKDQIDAAMYEQTDVMRRDIKSLVDYQINQQVKRMIDESIEKLLTEEKLKEAIGKYLDRWKIRDVVEINKTLQKK